MTSGSTASWQIDGENVKTVTDFIFLGSYISVEDNFSHEIKRCLLLGRKAMTNLDRILKSRGITLLTKVKALFLVVVQGCDSWTIQKVECQRIDAFKLWCWRILRVPRTARRSNQSILKETNPEYSLEGLVLKLQCFVCLMQRFDSLEKTLMLGKIEGKRRRWWERVRWLETINDPKNMSFSKCWEMVKNTEAWYAAVHGATQSQT